MGHGTYNLSGNAVLHASAALNDPNNPTPLIQLGQGDNNATGVMAVSDSAQVISDGTLDVGNLGHGTLTQNGPSTVVSAVNVYVGRESGSDGTLNVNGGSFTAGTGLIVGHNTGSSATPAISGGSLDANGAARIGPWGNGTVAQSGGSISADRLDVGGDVLIRGTIGDAVYNMSAGSLNTVGGFALDTIAAQPGSTGELNLSGTANYAAEFLIVGDHLSAFPTVYPGGDGTLSLAGSDVTLTTLGLWMGATGTLEINSGSGVSTIQTTLDAASNGGTFLMGGDLAMDLSTLDNNADITLIENLDATAGVTGFFDGLPEDTTFLDDSETWWVTITYDGGNDGNDILLTNLVDAASLLDADFDLDSGVDGNDFFIWQRGFGTLSGATKLQGDADDNDAVNGLNLALWESQFGQTASPLSSQISVPEPTTLGLLLTSLSGLGFIRKR